MTDKTTRLRAGDGTPLPHDYEERARSQALSWAQGHPYHERINDECCPDFSCCHPAMFTRDAAERWNHYRQTWGRVN